MITEIVKGNVFETSQLYLVFLIPITKNKKFIPNRFIGEIEKRYPEFKNQLFDETPGFRVFHPVSTTRALCGIVYDPRNAYQSTITSVGKTIDSMHRNSEIALVITGRDLIQRYRDDGKILLLLLERLHESPTRIHLYSNNVYNKQYEIPFAN